MKWIILACLGLFFGERWRLLHYAKADNCLEGLGLVLMFLAGLAAFLGQMHLIWSP
jgi:hypothetical protein